MRRPTAPILALALAALVAGVQGGLHLGWLGRIVSARATFPLDLEWMEGGVLVHAHRLAHGQGVYVEPSLEFIPFLYTPLYPATLAALSKIFPLGYALGRVVSLLAFAGALSILVLLTLRQSAAARPTETWTVRSPLDEARGRGPAPFLVAAVAIAASGVVASGFVFSGTFYDLVRGDSFVLALQTVALALAYLGRGHRSAVAAGVVIALAFFTKQTASLVGVAVGLGLLVAAPRRAITYGLAAAVVLAGGVLLLQKTSDGWFWKYVFEGHQSHAFNRQLAFVESPLRILRFEGPLLAALVAATVALAFGRKLRRADAIPLFGAVAGLVSGCVGMGTQWAFDNAYIPAVFFPALATAVLVARLGVHALAEDKPGARAFAVLTTAALALQLARIDRPVHARWAPSRADRAAAERFLAILRAQPGELFIPFHPFYGVLAGKKPYVHRMGVWDVATTYGRPKGLDEALASGRFDRIVLDWKSRPGEWPHVDAGYTRLHTFADGVDAVRSFSGAETSPRFLLAPRRAPERPAGARVIADFDGDSFGDATLEGEAFGVRPSPVRGFGQGSGIADSAANGASTTGVLRTASFTLSAGQLRFELDGPADAALRVFLLAGGEIVAEASPHGKPETVAWSLAGHEGKSAVLVIEDRSTAAGLAVDEILIAP